MNSKSKKLQILINKLLGKKEVKEQLGENIEDNFKREFLRSNFSSESEGSPILSPEPETIRDI